MNNNQIKMQILVNDKPITEYSNKGMTYIEGRKKSKYTIKVTNNKLYQRVLAVPTVDGLSVINGKRGNYTSPGIILEAGQSYEFTGWRIDLKNTRQFIFSSKKTSYSSKSAQGKDNLGVIGLAVFNELCIFKIPPLVTTWNCTDSIVRKREHILRSYDDVNTVSIGSPLGTIQNYCKNDVVPEKKIYSSIGTEMGKKQISEVQNSVFNRTSRPLCIMEVYYNEKRQLEKMGIIVKSNKKTYNTPQAFPGQFCVEI